MGARGRRSFRRVAAIAGGVAVAVELARFVRLSPGLVDEGMTLDFIRAVASGKRVHRDFVDAYGPLHHLGPALAFALAGGRVWGVRAWLLLVKGCAVALSHRLVSHVASPALAWLTTAWMTVLLALPWQALQTPYAWLHCVPLIVGVQLLLVPGGGAPRATGPRDPTAGRIALAGILTGCVLLVKVTSGAFLLAGGVLHCLCWLPRREDEAPRPGRVLPYRVVVALALLGCAGAFLSFVRRKIDPLFFLYFDVPLVVVLGWTAWCQAGERVTAGAARDRLRACVLYAACAAGTTSAVLVAYFGPTQVLDYVSDLVVLLRGMTYEHAVQPVGERGLYRGFGEWWWPQFPWAVTATFVVWALSVSSRSGRAALGAAWPEARRVASSLALFATLGMFSLYAYLTDVHVLGGMLPAGPAFFVLGGQLVRVHSARLAARGVKVAWIGPAAAALVLLWTSTLLPMPSSEEPWLARGGWTVSPTGGHATANRLEHLAFSTPSFPATAAFSPPPWEWEAATNAAAMLIDDVAADDEDVLVASRNELVTFHSFTRAPGGRHRLLFYMLRLHLLDAVTFRRLVPKEVVADIVAHPPRIVVVDQGEAPPLLLGLPELQGLGKHYELLRAFPPLLVLARKDVLSELSR